MDEEYLVCPFTNGNGKERSSGPLYSLSFHFLTIIDTDYLRDLLVRLVWYDNSASYPIFNEELSPSVRIIIIYAAALVDSSTTIINDKNGAKHPALEKCPSPIHASYSAFCQYQHS